MQSRQCYADNCDRAAHCRGVCRKHYYRLLKHGSAEGGRVPPGTLRAWIRDNADHTGNECLIWPFGRTPAGYGYLSVAGLFTNASRYMCAVAHGPPPTPQHDAAHSCGRGSDACTNPRHLRWATKAENMADRVGHGTAIRGALQGRSKLDDATVRQIRALNGSVPQAKIAARFGVDQAQVSRIVTRKQWAWLD